MSENQFNDEQVAILKEVVQFVKDIRSWGRLRDYVGKTVVYLGVVGAFFVYVKDPLFILIGWMDR